MPNGDPDFADKMLPELEAFFAPFSAACHQFAEKYNIKIDKYYHQFPSWSFLFRHPAGGIGQIQLMKKSESQLVIYESWWHDDYDKALEVIANKEAELKKNFHFVQKGLALRGIVGAFHFLKLFEQIFLLLA